MISQEVIRELIDYDPDTGIIVWKERDARWFKTKRDCNAWNTRYSGKEAGKVYTGAMGYQARKIAFFDKQYLAHRIIWIYMAGDLPPENIDHINRDGTDNRWDNLRAASALENRKNTSRSRRNTSGHVGVVWDKNRSLWMAQGKINNKTVFLGRYEGREDAAIAASKFREDNGYDQGHGLELAPYMKVVNK